MDGSGRGVVLSIQLPLTVVQTVATILGLALPAFLVTAAAGGKEGVRDLLGRLLRWRVGLHWYLFVLFGLPMGVLLSAIVLHGAAPLGALARNWALLFTAFLPGVIVPFLHTNLWKELGWTGFLQSTLQGRRGPLLGSLIVVPFFALFHVPARFIAGWIVDDHTPLSQVPTVALGYFVSAALVAVFLRVLIMWIYNGSGCSVILVGLFHSAFNMTIGAKVMPQLLNLPASETSLMCLAVLAVLAVAVVEGDLAEERQRQMDESEWRGGQCGSHEDVVSALQSGSHHTGPGRFPQRLTKMKLINSSRSWSQKSPTGSLDSSEPPVAFLLFGARSESGTRSSLGRAIPSPIPK